MYHLSMWKEIQKSFIDEFIVSCLARLALILNSVLENLFSILDLHRNWETKSSQVETHNRLSTYFWIVLYLDLDFFCSGLLLFDREPEEVERLRLLERLFLSLSLSLSLSLLRGLSFFLFSWLLLRDLRFRWLSFSFFLGAGLRLRLLLVDALLAGEPLADLFLFLSFSFSFSLGLLLVLSFPFSTLLLRDLLRSLFLSRLRDLRLLSLLFDLERDLFFRLIEDNNIIITLLSYYSYYY